MYFKSSKIYIKSRQNISTRSRAVRRRRQRQSFDVCFLQRVFVENILNFSQFKNWFFSFNFPLTEVILGFFWFFNPLFPLVYDDFSLVAAVVSGAFELLPVVCFCCLLGPDCDCDDDDDDGDGRFSENRSLPCTRTTLFPVEPLRGRVPAARAGPSPKEPVRKRPLPPGRFVTSTVRLPAESHLFRP